MGNLPNGWEEESLGNIFVFEKKSEIKAGEGTKEGKYKFFTSSDTQSKYIDTFTFDGEYLIFGTGGQASLHYCKEKFSTSTDCFVISITDKVQTKYIYYYLKSKMHLLENGFKGAGLKHISKDYLKKIKIKFPKNKETQKKIVSILEKAEKLKEKRKEANDLVSNYLAGLFSKLKLDGKKNDICHLSDLVEIKMGQSPPGQSYNELGDGVPLINGPTEFGQKNPMEIQWTTKPTKKSKKGDILFCVRGATAGKLNWSDKEYCIGRGIAAITPKNKKLAEYIYAILKSNYSHFQNIGQGSTFINIDKKKIENFKVPRIDELKMIDFSNTYKKVEIVKEFQRENTDKINILFDSLMQKAFKGELIE